MSRKDTLHQLRLPSSFAKVLVVVVLLNCVALQAQQAQQQASPLNSPAIESKVNALLKQMTLEEIGSLLGITRERVRQIKEKALSRLRHVSRARALESFLA